MIHINFPILFYVIISSFYSYLQGKLKNFSKSFVVPPLNIFFWETISILLSTKDGLYYTHTSTICTYTIYTGGTAFSARKTPAIAMPETSCASAVFYPFHLFSLFLVRSLLSLSFSFYLYPTPRTFENRYSKIIFHRFFEQYSTMRYQN